jgi:2-octaprenyl-6-methoxyphenol hydroxylase
MDESRGVAHIEAMSGATQTDVLVSGGGFAGLALALALGQAGVGVTVIEPAAPGAAGSATFDGRVSSIAPDVRRMLEQLGVWGRLTDVQRVTDIVVSGGTVGGAASPFFLHFAPEDSGSAPFDMVENRFLHAALASAAAERPEVRIVTGARIADLATPAGHVAATLSTGETLTAPLLVAAEGRDSPLRERFGIKVTGWSYGQWGIVCTVAHERPHEGVAQEYFLPSGSFAILPLTGNRSSLVWTEREDLAKAVMALDEADFAAEIARRFTDYLGAVTPIGTRSAWPLRLQLARDYVAPRFALLGDAAHVVHPLAGQGLNLSLRDAAALAEAVVDAGRLGLDLGSMAPLETYQRRRRIDAALMGGVTEGLNRLFSNDQAPLRTVREAGLELVNAVAPVRRFFARAAAGQGFGEAPRLLKGEAL